MSWITSNKLLWFESYETIESEITKLASMWYDSIWFLWWEPTIHPHFLDFISLAKSNGFKNIEVISNGSKFENYDFLKSAVVAGLTRVSISFHSIIGKQESLLTWWIDGIIKKKLRAVLNLLHVYNQWLIEKEISVNIVVSKVNYLTIKKTILALYKLWVKSFRLNFIQLEWNSTKNYSLVALKYEDFTEELSNILSLCKERSDLRINFEAIPWCFSWLDYETYHTHAEHKMDSEKDKVSRSDIDFVSRDIVDQFARRKELKGYLNKCKNCFLLNTCEGIWKRNINYFKYE